MSQYNNPYAGQVFATTLAGSFGGGGAGFGTMPYGGGNHPNQGSGGTYPYPAMTVSYDMFTSTQAHGFPGSFSPPQMDPTLVQREAAKYDGIIEGYWTYLIEGFTLPWLGGADVYENAKALVGLARSPSPQHAVGVVDRKHRAQRRDWVDEEMAEMAEMANREYERRMAEKYGSRAAVDRNIWGQFDVQNAVAQQQALSNSAHLSQQSLMDRLKGWFGAPQDTP